MAFAVSCGSCGDCVAGLNSILYFFDTVVVMSRLVFSPLSIWLLLGLVLLVIVGLPLLFLGVIGAALAGLGFSFWVIVLLLRGGEFCECSVVYDASAGAVCAKAAGAVCSVDV